MAWRYWLFRILPGGVLEESVGDDSSDMFPCVLPDVGETGTDDKLQTAVEVE